MLTQYEIQIMEIREAVEEAADSQALNNILSEVQNDSIGIPLNF